MTKHGEERHGFPSSSVGRAFKALLRGPCFISQLRSSDHFLSGMRLSETSIVTSFTKSHSCSLDEHLYICSRWTPLLKVVSHLLMVRCINTSNKVTGYWRSMERMDMDYPVAQFVETQSFIERSQVHFPAEEFWTFFSRKWDCQRHLLSLLYQITFKQSRWTFIHMFKMNSCTKGS